MSCLYHLSWDNQNKKTFKPRVPQCVMDGEDIKQKRVCFSSSIIGCLRALYVENFLWYGEETYYVHTPFQYDGMIKTPNESEVPDVKQTREKWLMNKVRLSCIGKIRVYKNYKDEIVYKWIEKYKNNEE